MKNYKLNLIKGLWDDSHEKQKPQRFGRYAAMLIMLLTLGVGQAWGWGWTNFESTSPATIYPGDQVTLQILLNGAGNGATYKAIGSGTTDAQANLTWNNSDTYYDYVEKAGDNNRWKFYFTPNSTGTWYWSIWLGWGSSVGDNGRYYNGSTSWNEGNSSYQSSSVTVSAVPKSGSLSAESAGTTSIALSWSKNSLDDDVIIFNGNSTTPSDGSTYNVGSNNVVYKGSGTSATITGLTANTSYTFYIYSIHQTKYYSASNNAIAKTDDVATPSISLAMGDGEDELVPGDIVHLTATRNNVDGTPNITYQYSTNDGSTWTNIAAATSSTTMNCTIPENLALSKTYKFRAQMTYSATTYTSSTLSSNVSVQAYYIAGSNGSGSNTDANWLEGKHWSVNGTQLDVQESTSSPVISKTFTGCAAGYHVFKITNGTWGTTYGYSDLTSCNVRYKNGSDNNLEFYLLSAATVKVEFNISTKKIIVTVTHTGNHKTFYVRNTTDWPALYLYNWTVPTNGDWPGQTGADNGGPSHSVRSSITSSQWWAVTIYDGSTGFLLNNGVATDADGHYQSADQTYSGITDGNWYELASTNGTSMTLTSVATSANNTTIIKAPTITTDAASSITATTATLQGDFTINHDKVTDYGFYLLQSNEESRTVEQVIAGTKKQIGTSLNADATDATKAISGLTGHTKYFYVAYATNGFGTSYGSVRSFTTPYSVTFNNNGGSGSMNVQSISTTATLTANNFTRTNYYFDSWNTESNGTGTKYTNGQSVTPSGNLTLYAQWKRFNIVTGGKIYFNNSVSNFTNNIFLVVGHDVNNKGAVSKHSVVYQMTQISNTQLYYVALSGLNWQDATYYAIIGSSLNAETLNSNNAWGSADLSTKGTSGYTAAHNSPHYDINNAASTFYITTASAGNNQSMTITYIENGYSYIQQYTTTSAVRVRNTGTDAYSDADGDYPTSITIQGTYMSADGTSGRSSSTYDDSDDYNTYRSVITGKVSMSHGDMSGEYVFDGWGTTNSSISSTSATYEFNQTAATTVYAFFTKKWVVTFNKNGHGVEDTPDTQYLTDGTKASNPGDLSETGYTFGGWYTNSACTGTAWVFGTNTITEDVDLYAKWTANEYTVTLDLDEDHKGDIAGATTSQDIYYDDATVTVPNRPTAAEGYKFDGYYTEQLGAGTKVINANGTWIASVTGYTDASKHWIHADDVTLYAYYKKAEITALTLDATVVETNATVGLTPTISPTPEGDTKLCFYVFHGNDNPLYPQPDITWNGTKATFNAGETSGTYKIGVALRTGTDCDGGTLLDSTTVSYQVAGTHSVTVRYKCGDEVIKAASSLEGIRPLDWSDAITAPNIIGYSFTGWSAGDGVTLTDDDGSSTKTSTAAATIKIKAIYDGYLTANYSKKRIIYFNNTLNWENVYVYFYKNASYWNDTYGTGCNKTYGFTDTPFEEGLYGQMQPVEEGSKIYYFDAEAAGVNASYQTVVFTELDQHTYNWFSKTGDVKNKVIKRDDYYSSKLPMYVPLTVQTSVSKNDNTADYYWQGYWMNYPENTGYTLKIYNKKTRSDAPDAGSKDPVELKSIPFEFTADKTMPMELDVDLEAGQTYGFRIWRNDGLNTGAGSYYGNTGTMTANAEGWDMKTTASSNAGLQTTAAGNYKFLMNFYEVSSNYQYRVSVTYPVASGDYRLLYKDDVHTLWHPSAVIPKANAKDTVSFFVRKGQHAYLKLQKCTGLGAGTVTWTDTVTWWNNGTGIHSAVTQDSVYNICLKHNASTGKLEIENVEAYTGNYYIRTDAANSKWDNYRTDPDHLMTYSEYSITHGGYSHYYTHWVQANDDNRKNIKFCIANDYSPCISDTLIRESNAVSGWENINNYIESNGDLKRNANVRFMWDRHTNTISRAYVDGAQGDNSANFLYILNTDATDKIRWSAESALTNHKVTFMDNGDWIYEANIQAQPNAQIRLLSNWGESSTITQYFKGSSSTSEDLVGGSGSTWYDIRVIYDFKTNRLVASYIPRGEIDDQIAINADVMFIREHQGDIDQLTFKEKDAKMGAISKIETAYGVLRLNKWTINNKDKSTHDPLPSPKSRYERDLFYVSFPFRVSMEEVFGFGTYGTHWIIEYYDGASRAANGYWLESGPNWKFVTNRKNQFFEPYQGYIIALDLDEMSESSSIWANAEQVELYFPSYGTMSDITNASVNCTIPEHLCTINRSEEIGGGGVPLGSAYDRRVKDSHWNVISVPTYVNTSNLTFANTDWITTADDEHVGPNFLYEWNPDDNSVTARSGVGYTYQAMHAYLVQYCGIITWTSSVSRAAAPRRNPAYRGEYEFRLEMMQNDQVVDQTYVKLSDNEHVTTGFEFNYDLSKEYNKNKANIYTLIGSEPVAGNVLPLSEQTTVVPVGVKIVANGDYTFSMPDGTEGINVTLIDTETGLRTSLSALDYTINLSAGTYNERFVLEISPVQQTPTGIENSEVSHQHLDTRKVLIDGILYIVKDGKMFDARGAVVK